MGGFSVFGSDAHLGQSPFGGGRRGGEAVRGGGSCVGRVIVREEIVPVLASMSRPNSKGVLTGSAEDSGEPIDWEMRPGGMLVQKRDPDAAVATGPLIKIKVSHGLFGHDVSVPAHATFGKFSCTAKPQLNSVVVFFLLSCLCFIVGIPKHNTFKVYT